MVIRAAPSQGYHSLPITQPLREIFSSFFLPFSFNIRNKDLSLLRSILGCWIIKWLIIWEYLNYLYRFWGVFGRNLGWGGRGEAPARGS